MGNYTIKQTCAEKDGSTLLQLITNACKMQGQIPRNNMFWHVNKSIPIKLL